MSQQPECPVCAGESAIIVFSQDAFKCGDCGHMWRSRAEEFDYSWYEKVGYWVDEPDWEIRSRAIVAMFEPWISEVANRQNIVEGQPHLRIMEIGSAGGESLEPFALAAAYGGQSPVMVYNDIKDVAVESARRSESIICPVEEITPHADLDIIFGFFVLEHLKDPIAALNVLYAALKPGGRLMLYTDDANALDGADSMLRHPEHMHVFSAESVSVTVRRLGFAPLKIYQDTFGYLLIVLERPPNHRG